MYRRASGADAASSASVAGVVVGSVAARMLSGMSAGGAEAFGVDGPGWVGSGAGAKPCAVCQGCGCAVCHGRGGRVVAVSYTHLRAHETRHDLVCRLLLEKKNNKT